MLKNKKKSIRKPLSKLKEIIATGMTTALGLIIALSWKDVLTEYFDKLASVSPVQGTFITAIIITLLSAIALLIISTLVADKK